MIFCRQFLLAALALYIVPVNAVPPEERFWGEVKWAPAPSNDLHLDDLETMAHKLGARLASMPTFIAPRGKLLYFYGGHSWFPPTPPSWVFHGAVPTPGSGFPTTFSRDPYTYYAFQSGNSGLDDFLKSAYLQEVDPEYSPLRFYDYPVKNQKIFHNRMWFSQGYAWQYVARNEPLFGGVPILLTGFGYFVDGISVILLASIVNRLVEDPVDPEHLSYAATGVGLIAVNRLITVPFGKSHIEKRNRIARSGYKVPR